MVLGEQPSEQKFEDVKADFFKTYKENIGLGKYHRADLERVRRNNEWVKAFYKYSQENHEKCVSMLDEVLTWRNEFGSNDLVVSEKPPVSEEMFKKGGIFYKNEDINCTPMLHFAVKTHKKDNFPQAQVFRFISYFFELKYKFNLDDPIIIVFDMTDAGYSNLDMDMIKFVVTCLKTYYPGLIDYMIVYQMPFIFNAAWKIIKNWLPPNSVNLIKFCDKKGIKEYIQDSQLFTHMGGTDNFKYVYDPRMFILKESKEENDTYEASLIVQSETAQQILETKEKNTETSFEPILEQSKSITIENKENSIPKLDLLETSEMNDNQIDAQEKEKESLLSPNKSSNSRLSNGTINKISDAMKTNDQILENVLTTPFLNISPGDELIFNVTDGKQDITQFIKLTNTSDKHLAYKIKITSPDKFRVKPGTGIIPTSSNAQIMINFLKEFHNSSTNHRDKFLILWSPIDEKLQASDLSEFWKQATQTKQNISEHKVKCHIKRKSSINKSPSQINDKKKDQSLPVSPSNSSINSYFSPRETSRQNLDVVKTSKRKSNLPSTSSSPTKTPEKTTEASKSPNAKNNLPQNNMSKIEMLEIKKVVSTKDESLLTSHRNLDEKSITFNELNNRFYKLDRDINSLVNNQQRIGGQLSQVIYLIYFLIMLNVIQFLFKSSFFDSFF